jgi:hypothetical protein
MASYESPRITELGSVQDLTLGQTFHKSPGASDTIIISDPPNPPEVITDVPGS